MTGRNFSKVVSVINDRTRGSIIVILRRRCYRNLWLLTALFLLAQALSPMAALAEVSVRCLGASSPMPCARAVLPVADGVSATLHTAEMSCCRTMPHCRMRPALMSACVHASPVPSSRVTVSAPECLVSITPLTVRDTACVTPAGHHWLLHAAPALAPPALASLSVPLAVASLFAFPLPFDSPPPALPITSHGLRAPPCA